MGRVGSSRYISYDTGLYNTANRVFFFVRFTNVYQITTFFYVDFDPRSVRSQVIVPRQRCQSSFASQAVPRAGDRSYVTGSIRGWSRSHLTYEPGGCSLEEPKLTSQFPFSTVEFSVFRFKCFTDITTEAAGSFILLHQLEDKLKAHSLFLRFLSDVSVL